MMVVLLIAGIGFLMGGLLGIGFGIPVKEFSFGNTLILTGVVSACTGMILLGLWTVVRELKNIAQRLAPGVPTTAVAEPPVAMTSRIGTPLPSATTSATPRDRALDRDRALENDGFLFNRDEPSLAKAGDAASVTPPSTAPWQSENVARDRVRSSEMPSVREPADPQPAKPRRNLLFSSSSRKERERAEARTADPSAADLHPAPAAPPHSSEAPSATFDDAWPQLGRPRTTDVPQRRSGRTPSTFTDANTGATAADRHPPAAQNEDPAPVTVLKSGVVDGMAYSLYSDGSIEAQMPEGMMRFASIDELRAHLDQRS